MVFHSTFDLLSTFSFVIFFPAMLVVASIHLFPLQMFWQFTSHNLCDYFVVKFEILCASLYMQTFFQHFLAVFGFFLVFSLFNAAALDIKTHFLFFFSHPHSLRCPFFHRLSSHILFGLSSCLLRVEVLFLPYW